MGCCRGRVDADAVSTGVKTFHVHEKSTLATTAWEIMPNGYSKARHGMEGASALAFSSVCCFQSPE
jgi:hypothetical protein